MKSECDIGIYARGCSRGDLVCFATSAGPRWFLKPELPTGINTSTPTTRPSVLMRIAVLLTMLWLRG